MQPRATAKQPISAKPAVAAKPAAAKATSAVPALVKVVSVAAVVAAITVGIYFTGAPVYAAGETLTIKGDGVDKTVTFSRSDLEGLKSVMQQHCYSTTNNYPTNKTEYAAGVPLMYLLQQAGLKDSAQMITVTATDGYKREFTLRELLRTTRYYFPTSGDKQTVPAMVSLKSSASGFNNLENSELKLIMGQRSRGEQNNPWIVKYLSTIEVSTRKPAKWAEVTFSKSGGSDAVTLQLQHESIDLVKIYYTTDGSTPTLESKMYNVSASYFQPQLNQPLTIDKTTVVKAIAIGAGREDSSVASITVSIGGETFKDLAGYEWAKPAIEDLAGKGILSGVGDNRFDPAGGLTRAMFVTMLGRAYNGKATTTPTKGISGASDVDFNTWYGPYVWWAIEKGIVSGYPDGTFKPMNMLTVEEMIVITVRAGGLKTVGGAMVVTGVSSWAQPFVIIAESNKILERGHISIATGSGITVSGKNQARRAEAAVTLHRLLNK